jgi:hypothetical protein
MSRTRFYLASALLVFCVSCALQFDARPTKKEAAKGTISINLDLTPLTSPLSTLILINQTGNARVVRYSRSQLAVISIWEGKTPEDIQSRLGQVIRQPAFADSCNGQYFGGGGLSSGDQFQLLIKSQEDSERRCLGFVEQAPVTVRQLIQDLTALPQQLTPASLAEAYVRSEVVTVERLSAIRRAGQMRFLSLSEVPPDVRPLFTDSLGRPREFVPLNRQQHEVIRILFAPATDLILTTDGSGSQFTLFQAQPAQTSKGADNENLISSIQDTQVFPI